MIKKGKEKWGKKYEGDKGRLVNEGESDICRESESEVKERREKGKKVIKERE